MKDQRPAPKTPMPDSFRPDIGARVEAMAIATEFIAKLIEDKKDVPAVIKACQMLCPLRTAEDVT